MSSGDIWQLWAAIVTSIGGASVLLLGLSSWLGKLWSKRILANEAFEHKKELEDLKAQLRGTLREAEALIEAAHQREQATLDTRVHVSKAQFDLEFSLYKRLWARLSSLRGQCIRYWVALRQDVEQHGMTPERLLVAEKNAEEIKRACEEFAQFFVARAPFIAQAVEDWFRYPPLILEAINGIGQRALQMARAQDRSRETADQLREWQLAVNGKVTELATVIRQRLASVAIVS